MNLYKVFEKSSGKSAYVAAECQQKAAEKYASHVENEDMYCLSVEYISKVFV